MPRRTRLLVLICMCTSCLWAQDMETIQIHGFATQGFLFSSNNNYLSMKSSQGSLQWTDGAVSLIDSLSDHLRVGIQLHMYQLGDLGGPNIQVDWASGDYKINDHLGFRAGKVKTVTGLFNDSQDIDALYLWILLPQSLYPTDNKSFLLSHLGGEVYGDLPLGRAGSLQYRGYAGQANLDLTGGYLKIFSDEGVTFTTPPGGKTYGGNLRWAAPKGLTVGSSARVQVVNGASGTATLHLAPFVLTSHYAQFQYKKFYAAIEYRRAPLNPILTIGQATIPFPLDQHVWYVMGSYHVSERLQLGSYYSHYINTAGDTSLPSNYSKDWDLSGRWDFNDYFYAKLEGHFLDGTGLGYYTSTNPRGLKPKSNILAAKIGFSF